MSSMRTMRQALCRSLSRHEDAIAVWDDTDSEKPTRVLSLEWALESETALDALADRIRSNVTVDPVTQCWLWRGHQDHSGYGRIKIHGRSEIVSRVVCALVFGPMRTEHDTRHDQTCSSRSCCNPEHIRPGSRAQNVQDGKKTFDYRSSRGDSNRDRRRVRTWAKRARDAGVVDVRVLPAFSERRWDDPLIREINRRLVAR